MPPRDILSTLYEYPNIFFPVMVGEPGAIQKYWSENMDLYETLDMPPDLDSRLFRRKVFG